MFTSRIEGLSLLVRDTDKSDRLKPFPVDASVRIGIVGLAYCKLGIDQSEVFFLSHVPDHKLDMLVFQKKRTDRDSTLVLACRVEARHTVSVKVTGSDRPDRLDTDGDFLFHEVVNLSKLHGIADAGHWTIKPHTFTDPIPLMLEKCAFYAEEITSLRFNIFESTLPTEAMPNPPRTRRATRKLGDVLGGKIRCSNPAREALTIEVGGTLDLEPVFPLVIDGHEMVYDIYFLNRCVTNSGGSEDFHYYYDLLEDSRNPQRRIIIERAEFQDNTSSPQNEERGKTAELAACNPIVISPVS